MTQRSRKNSHNRKGRKPKLPPKADWLKDKPLNKDDLFIRILNRTSPIRKPSGPWQEFGYWQEKQKLKK
jgi:hypothetical protein